MSGSLEVRQFLLQQDDGTAKQGGVPAQRTGEPARISDEQIHRARLAVAAGAVDAEDCRTLLDMLGLVSDDSGVPPIRQ